MDYYLNRFKSKVSSVAAQVSQALPGNPVFREYEVHEQVASAGPGLSWKIYSGTKNSTKQPVSIWLFEKRQVEKWPKQEREAFPELLKRGVSQLTRLRHPRLLVVERALEESRETFAFCTEPVFACLANVFTQSDSSVQSHLQDFFFLDVEIRHGLFQLSEALKFLHNDAKILHGNLCPASIIINERGAWKLAGFDFCILNSPLASGQVTFEVNEWDRHLMACMNPELDYAAPELVEGIKCDTYADIFSFGVLICTLFNDNKPFFESKGLLDDYKRNIEKLKSLNIDARHRIPDILRADTKACLNITPELRPDAIQLTKIAYFDDSLLKIFLCLDSLMQMDNSQKMMFFKGLSPVLSKFAKRPLLQKVFPYLSAELNNVDLVPFILPNIFSIAEQTSNKEFASEIFPALIPIFATQRPYQTVLLLLQNIPLFLQKTPDSDVRKHVLPLIYNSISNENPKIQLRVQTLICLSKLMLNLEQWMVSDQILPALPKINSKEPAILMAVLGVYKLAFETEKFGISTDQCAKSVLPFLISSFVENSLNLQQFERYSVLIHKMLEKVESEQRQRLKQLSAAQEEQRNIDFNEILGSTASTPKLDPDLNSLNGSLFASNAATGKNGSDNVLPFDFGAMASAMSFDNKGSLSLEEKKRLAAERERLNHNRSAPTEDQRVLANTTTGGTALLSSDFNVLSGVKNSIAIDTKSQPATTLNLNEFASWTTPSSNDFSKAINSDFTSFPQPPPSNTRNLVQRSGAVTVGKTSLDDLLGNFGSIHGNNNRSMRNNNSSGTTPMNVQSPLFPAVMVPTMMAPQTVQPNRSSTPNFQAFAANAPVNSSTNVIKDPFDDLLR